MSAEKKYVAVVLPPIFDLEEYIDFICFKLTAGR
jgi:hypothetical protein